MFDRKILRAFFANNDKLSEYFSLSGIEAINVLEEVGKEKLRKDYEYRHEYYLRNKEKIKAYTQANKERINQRTRERRAKNKEKYLEQRRLWYQVNKERLNEERRRKYAENKEQINAVRRAKAKALREGGKEYATI